MSRYICGGEKYKFGGEKEDTIVLPVEIADLPETIEVEGITLLRKSEFHVSLVCMGRLMERCGISYSDLIYKVVKDFCAFVKTHEISFIGYRDEYKLVKDGEKKTVVVMSEVSNLNAFFDLVNSTYGYNFGYPPTHVTLYTLEPDKGIFLIEEGDIREKTKVVPSPAVTLT